MGWSIKWNIMKFRKSVLLQWVLSGVFAGNALFYSAFLWIFWRMVGFNFKGGVQTCLGDVLVWLELCSCVWFGMCLLNFLGLSFCHGRIQILYVMLCYAFQVLSWL